MHVSYCLISAVAILAGRFQSAPILGLDGGLLGTNLQPLGGLIHPIKAVPMAGQLTNGLLGVSKDDATAGLISINGLHGEPKDADVKAKPMAFDLGSKLSGILRVRRRTEQPSLPSPTSGSTLSNTPFIGYMPGMPALPALSSLPIIRSAPGLPLIPGLGTTSAASGIGSAVDGIASARRNATEAALDGPMNGMSTSLNSAFLGLMGGVSNAPTSVDSLLVKKTHT